MNGESEQRDQALPPAGEAPEPAPQRVEVGRDHWDMSLPLVRVRLACLFLALSVVASGGLTFTAVKWGMWDWLFYEHPLLALVAFVGVFIGMRALARIRGLAIVNLLLCGVVMALLLSLLGMLSDRMTGKIDLTLQTVGLIVIVMGVLLLWVTLVRWRFPLWSGVGLWLVSFSLGGIVIMAVWSIPSEWFHMLFLFGVGGGVTFFALVEMWLLRDRCERMSSLQAALRVYLDVIGVLLKGLKWMVWREGKKTMAQTQIS